jgi:hypothetical protein
MIIKEGNCRDGLFIPGRRGVDQEEAISFEDRTDIYGSLWASRGVNHMPSEPSRT